MYWPGESKEPVQMLIQRWRSKKGLKRVWKEEILCAYYSDIPICCIVWYLLTVYLCLLIKRDLIVLPLMFGKNGWEEFCESDYYRCPLCRVRKKIVKVVWWEKKND